MFTIELLLIRESDRDNPVVVDRVVSERARLDDVNRTAKSLLAKGGLRFRDNPPNAYRILDREGVVVSRSWERPL
jgi:hypothetical protein